jgi:hypothetical protein
MDPNRTRAGVASLILACAIAVPWLTHAQSSALRSDTSVKAIVNKAVEYLKGYQDALQFVLADESVVQDVFKKGRKDGHRETSGEYFLTYLASEQRWVGVRDIATVDGVPVPNRENLRELLTKAPVVAIGRHLADRNARHNIGSVVRNMNDPMFALLVLHDQHRGRFKFDRRRIESTPSGPLVTLEFTEREEPTLVAGADRKRIYSKGELTIDAATGRLVRTVMTLKDKTTTGTLTTVFAPNEKLGLWVPSTMDERYELEVADVKDLVIVKSTYTIYRRFNVNVVIK